MKKLLVAIILVGLVLSLPLFAMGEDSKEVLTLKRDLAQEKVVRIQSQLALMQQQFAEGQKVLADTQKLLKDLDGKLSAMEPKADKPKEAKPEGKPKVEEKKK